MRDIAFMTYIHNGEKTMRKSIESVLNQEEVDLAYYLIDNASTDGTWDIMCEYADKDSRIRLIQNENSLVRLPEYIKGIKDCEYFAVLDADDWYEPAFAKAAIAFAKKEDLDIVAVGRCLHISSDEMWGEYKVEEKPIVLKNHEIHEHIELLSKYFRPMWGKIFKLSVVHRMDFSKFEHLANRGIFYAIDTVFSLSAIRISRKIGILNKIMHHYQMDTASDSYRYHPNRFYAVTVWLETWLEQFVDIRKFVDENQVEERKKFFVIIGMYFCEIRDILLILERSEMDAESFLKEINAIATCPLTEICMQQNSDMKTLIILAMMDKIPDIEKDPRLVALFYECLKAFDGVELFKEIAKNTQESSETDKSHQL